MLYRYFLILNKTSYTLTFMQLPEGEYPEDVALVIWEYIFLRLFSIELFVIQVEKSGWKKLWYIYIIEHYVAVKKNEGNIY